MLFSSIYEEFIIGKRLFRPSFADIAERITLKSQIPSLKSKMSII